jgi:hypothetical protein
MHLEYELTPQDYADWGTFHYHTGPRGAANHRIVRFAFPIFWVATTLPGAAAKGVGTYELIVWTLAVLYVLAIPAWFRRESARRTRRVAAEGFSRGSTGFRTLTLDERGITESTAFYTHETYWPGIERVVETDGHVFVYTGPNAAFIVPKYALDENGLALRSEIEHYRPDVAA